LSNIFSTISTVSLHRVLVTFFWVGIALLNTITVAVAQSRPSEEGSDLESQVSDSTSGLPQYHLSLIGGVGPTFPGSVRAKELLDLSPTYAIGLGLDAYPSGGRLGVTTGVNYSRRTLSDKSLATNSALIQSFEIPIQASYRRNADSLNTTGLKASLGVVFAYNQFKDFSANVSSSTLSTERFTVVDTTNRANLLFGTSLCYGFRLGETGNVLEIGINYRQSLGKTLAIVKGLGSDTPLGFQPRLGSLTVELRFRFARWIDATRNEWQPEDEVLTE
jgi:hypothetical protein